MTEKTPSNTRPDEADTKKKARQADAAPAAAGRKAPAAATDTSSPDVSTAASKTPATAKDTASATGSGPASDTASAARSGRAKKGSPAASPDPAQDGSSAARSGGATASAPARHSDAAVDSGPTKQPSKPAATLSDPAAPVPPPARSGSPWQAALLLITFLLVLGLAAAVWYVHTQTERSHSDSQSQIRSSLEQARQAAAQADRATQELAATQSRLNTLASELRSARAELQGLNDAFQMITDRGSDLVIINDIDHLVTIAQQQLQLGGNVANAIISLETAQAQLARANRPNLASLLQTINGDLDRLRATTTVDVALLSSRLDTLSGLISQAPLLVPDSTALTDSADAQAGDSDDGHSPSQAASASASAGQAGGDAAAGSEQWWQRGLDQGRQWAARAVEVLGGELGQFISIRRVDDATALLVSPDQATRFRENLRLRIMTAQLALMMKQPQIWETETAALLHAIQSRYDETSPLTRQALRIARDVADTSIDASLPTVTNSIKALEALRADGAQPASGNEPTARPDSDADEDSSAAEPDGTDQPQPSGT